MAQKLKLDDQKREQQKTVDDTEKSMRVKAASVGNLIYKDVPVSDNEVYMLFPHLYSFHSYNAHESKFRTITR